MTLKVKIAFRCLSLPFVVDESLCALLLGLTRSFARALEAAFGIGLADVVEDVQEPCAAVLDEDDMGALGACARCGGVDSSPPFVRGDAVLARDRDHGL